MYRTSLSFENSPHHTTLKSLETVRYTLILSAKRKSLNKNRALSLKKGVSTKHKSNKAAEACGRTYKQISQLKIRRADDEKINSKVLSAKIKSHHEFKF